MEIGEQWAYREKAYTPGTPVLPVEIMQFGPRRSQKVRIKFLDGEYRGLDLWVPQVRLRVLWDEVEAWLEDEQRFLAASEASMDAFGSLEHDAAQEIFFAYPLPVDIVAGSGSNEGAIVEILDGLEVLAADLGIEVDALLTEPLAFVDREGDYTAPWPVTLKLARRIAEVHPEAVLGRVRERERELQEGAVAGIDVDWGRGRTFHIPAERCAERLREEQPLFELIRTWCGAPAIERFDEIEALRGEIKRLRGLIDEAVRWLEPHHPRVADRLRNQLDRPD